jgi:ornithine decarboxylase
VALNGDENEMIPWEDIPSSQLAANARYWEFAPGAKWHGFKHVKQVGYAMTDPNKLTLLTPGFNPRTGEYADEGIPAPVVAQYLRENQVVAEKNDLNSLLFLLTPGVESSKAGTLLSTLVAFKRRYDENVRLEDAIPEFVRRRPARYAGMRLRELCSEMHDFFRNANVSALQKAQFAPEHRPDMVMRPNDAVRMLTRNQVEYLPLDQLDGRIATTLWVVYPPGIATIIPGERLSKKARPMLDYLRMFEKSANLFPGFEAEIQGLYREIEADGSVRFYTYVAKE